MWRKNGAEADRENTPFRRRNNIADFYRLFPAASFGFSGEFRKGIFSYTILQLKCVQKIGAKSCIYGFCAEFFLHIGSEIVLHLRQLSSVQAGNKTLPV